MAFTAIANGDGSPNQQALMEQMALIVCVYTNQQAQFRAIIAAAGGGTVYAWSPVNGGAIPAWAVFVQGATMYIVVSGTTTAGQLMGQAAGGYWTTPGPGGGPVNTWWLTASNEVAVGISTATALLTGITAYLLVGDSYGAAIAGHLANRLAGTFGPAAVQLLTFGSPKPFTAFYQGSQPLTHLRVAQPNDPVPLLPPTVGGSVWTAAAQAATGNLGLSLRWVHQGTGWLLAADASLSPDGDDTGSGWLPTTRLAALSVQSHLYTNTGAILVGLASQPGKLNPQGLAIAAILAAVLDLPQTAGLVAAPPYTPTVAAGANAVSFANLAGPVSVSSATSLMLAAFPAWSVSLLPGESESEEGMTLQIRAPVDQSYQRITMFFASEQFTWTESHIINSQTLFPPLAPSAAVVQLLALRAAMLPSDVQLTSYRISVLSVSKGSELFGYTSAPDSSLQTAATQNLTNDCLVQGLIANSLGGSGIKYTARIFLSGLPDDAVKGGFIPNSAPAWWVGALGAYLAFLISNASVSIGTLALSKEISVAPYCTITQANGALNSTTLTITTNIPHQLTTTPPNNVVRISRLPGADASQPFNQAWLVASVPTPTTFTITMPLPFGATYASTGFGFAHKQLLTFVYYSAIGRSYARTRIRGNRVFAPRGRRKVRRTIGY